MCAGQQGRIFLSSYTKFAEEAKKRIIVENDDLHGTRARSILKSIKNDWPYKLKHSP